MPLPSLLAAADMIVMGPLPGNGYSAFISLLADMGVIEALASNGCLHCLRFSGF
jgi:hypothetical protein